jgi:hypothetical protein
VTAITGAQAFGSPGDPNVPAAVIAHFEAQQREMAAGCPPAAPPAVVPSIADSPHWQEIGT